MEVIEDDLGPIDPFVDPTMRALWPGIDRPDGDRVIPLLNGFAKGRAVRYWFAGVAPRTTADIYWFCRDGDAACPLGEDGVVDRSRTLGRPVFARIPGEASYSPYWWIRVVRVPDDYLPDSIKSVSGIRRAADEGRVRLEWYQHNFRGWIGPDKAIEHTLLVLDGTTLEDNGATLPDGRPSLEVPLDTGWHQQYSVKFYDFSESEGVLPPAFFAPEWTPPEVPAAPLLMMFRDCANGSSSPACAAGGPLAGAVTERALALDLTGDRDQSDTNNVLAALPRAAPVYPNVAPYSPLWSVQRVRIDAARDAELSLIDSTRAQAVSDFRDAAELEALVATGTVFPAEPLTKAALGLSPSDDELLFDAAAQIPRP